MKNNYLFPAIFKVNSDKSVWVKFPDIPDCFTDGESFDDGVSNALDVLGLHLSELECMGKPIPEPSLFLDLELSGPEVLVMIPIDMKVVRANVEDMLVERTLTIPSWVDIKASSASIDLSDTLVQALKVKLGYS